MHACICNGAEDSCVFSRKTHDKFTIAFTISYCELVMSLARESCRLSFADCPPAGSTKSVALRCSLKKSVQIYASSWRGCRRGVAHASFDHPCWCRPHPVCLWFTLALAHRPHLRQNSIFAMGIAGFLPSVSPSLAHLPQVRSHLLSHTHTYTYTRTLSHTRTLSCALDDTLSRT